MILRKTPVVTITHVKKQNFAATQKTSVCPDSITTTSLLLKAPLS